MEIIIWNSISLSLSLSISRGTIRSFSHLFGEQRPKVKIGGKLWRKSIEEKSIPSPSPLAGWIRLSSKNRARGLYANNPRAWQRRGGEEESRREKEGGRKTKLSIEPPQWTLDPQLSVSKIDGGGGATMWRRGHEGGKGRWRSGRRRRRKVCA